MRGAVVGVAAAALAWAPAPSAQPRVAIDAAADLGPVNRRAMGGNLEFITESTPAVQSFVASLPILRFPGGDADSTFRWNRPLAPACGRAGTDWDTAASIASRAGAEMFLETNILRDTPRGVAQWVTDARRRGVSVPFVGVGNEVWGHWDRGFRTPARYARDVRAHAVAIRAVSPDTAVVLSIGTFNEERWNREAIRRTAPVIDAVDYHFYPNHHEHPQVRPMEVVAGAEAIAGNLARLRAMIRQEAGARAERIGIVVGEWDGAMDPPPQSQASSLVTPRAYAQWSMANALFYGSAVGELVNGGVAAAMFYEVQGYRFGAFQGSWCLPGDPRVLRPKALALRLWLEHFGERRVAVSAERVPSYHVDGPTNWDGFSGEAPYLRAYASSAEQGRALRAIVVNRGDAATVPTVEIELRGFAPEPRARVWELGGALLDSNENVAGPPDALRITEREVAVTGATLRFVPRPFSVAAIEWRRRRE